MIIPIENNNLTEALNRFFRTLLEKDIVDTLLLPQAILSGKSYAHTLVKDAARIENAAPFPPVLMNNGAAAVSALTITNSERKIGAVLRACEIRAVNELVKFNQINPDQLMIIAVDCLGTLEPGEFARRADGNSGFTSEVFLKELATGKFDALRPACRTCRYPVWREADIKLGFLGMDISRELYVDCSEDIADKLELKNGEEPEARIRAISRITEDRENRLQAHLEQSRQRFDSIAGLLNEFARCKRCYNCRTECPICYCKECVFLTDIFEHMPREYFRWADRKGSIRMPFDTLLFHLTRLNHMGTSCIDCGLCSSACPNGLPVFELFQLIGKRVQGLFEYLPGMSTEIDSPLVTFQEQELESLG